MTRAQPTSIVDAATMSLTGHLTELRNRLLWTILAVAIGASLGFAFGEQLITLLRGALPPDVKLIQIELGDGFAIRLQIAFVVGVILAMPVILWHLWRFVAPGLTSAERRAVLPWIPMALVFFVLGVAVAYVVLPFAATFLLSFVPSGVDRTINIRSYFDFMSSLFLAFGVLMEFPILLVGLSKVGIVTSDRLRRSRRMTILGIAIFSAVVTPGGDLVSPFVLGLTLYILYEGTTVFIRRSGR
ncbi:MAG TPA: twin-arginine translocase subunit TatC [Candidatus Limnocylindrales bacterium]|jgi:sec-independent protein translocase protein TatC|nr:twin-arginine translocase subunit TatC [Candidatus Limnocylindrales bacterium]